EFTRKKLRVFSEGDEQGAAEETLDIAYEGEPVVIGLNASYLVEYLSVVGLGAVSFEFKSAREVVQILPVGEAGYNSFALIMPMSLGNTVQPSPAAKAPDVEGGGAEQGESEALPKAA
ncbi:MAG: hypothetical protein ABW208_04645, partial [Pyrinomonadaceae bacterium]